MLFAHSHLHTYLPHRHSKQRFFLLFLPQLFLFFADAILAFTFPIILARELGSATLVGAVISVYGIASIVFDILFPGIFRNISWRAQLIYSVILSILFTLSLHAFMLAAPLFLAVFSGVVRGAYRELMFFVRDETVSEEEPRQEHVRDYSILSMCAGILLIAGAMLGAHLLNSAIEIHTLTLLSIQGVALVTALIIAKLFEKKVRKDSYTDTHTLQTRKGLILTLHEWRILTPVTLAPLCMSALASWIIVLHLSFGGLFALSLGIDTVYAWTITFIYNASFLIIALALLAKGSKAPQNHKKRTSQYAMITSGLLLIPISLFSQHIVLVLAFIAASCVFFAIAAIFHQAVLANIAGRLDGHKLSFISLQNIWGSVAIIIASPIIGYLIDTQGFYLMYSIMGAGIFFTTIALRTITPNKIHIPQKELHRHIADVTIKNLYDKSYRQSQGQ